jgi:bacterioferritin-associated ferredoxin
VRLVRGELRVTPRARPDLVLPLAPRRVWRGYQTQSWGGEKWVELSAQRPVAGLCGSCGENYGGTGDCPLCNAARISALRALGRLGAPVVYVPPERPSPEAWRASLYGAVARPDPLPAPSPCVEWTCEVYGHRWWSFRGADGAPRDECGRCELKASDVLSLAKLGGLGR